MMTDEWRGTSEETNILRNLYKQLDGVHGAVSDLLLARRGFIEVAKRLTEGVPASALARATAGITYQSWIAVKIRCQLDTDNRSVSLARILEELASHPYLLTRDRFIVRYVHNRHVNAPFKTTQWGAEEGKQFSLWAQEGDRRFDEIAGVGALSLSEPVIRRDQSALCECAVTVRNFVNKQVAHHDETGFEARPVDGSLDAWLDLLGVDRCIDLIKSLLVKYWWLVHGNKPVGLSDTPDATS